MMNLFRHPTIRRLLTPGARAESILAIDGSALQALGFRGVILDLDNTLLPWDQEQIEPHILAHLAEWRLSGLQFGVVSNNMGGRVRRLAAQLQAPYAHRAYKPLRRGYIQVLQAMGLSPAEVVVIGDQLYTDVLGGNRMGFHTIWVKPISSREFVGTKITRWLERRTWQALQHSEQEQE